MKSHEYAFRSAALLRLLALPLLSLALFAGVMRAGARLNVFPQPHPIHDVDRTILLHQAEASRTPSGADIVLAGDSSCLMDVLPSELQRELGGAHRVLSLATLSYLDLSANARLIRQYATANPGKPAIVILLMHPESLRLGTRNPYFREVLENYLKGRDYSGPSDSRVLRLLGVGIAQARFIARALPIPLPGAWGRFYGFNSGLWSSMTASSGGAVDPHVLDPRELKGNPEYRLAESLKAQSESFRSSLPNGTRLFVGITPSPQSWVSPGHEANCRRMLKTWTEWLRADADLDLPSMLPDDQFATATHLSGTAARMFTRKLAAAIQAPPSRPRAP